MSHRNPRSMTAPTSHWGGGREGGRRRKKQNTHLACKNYIIPERLAAENTLSEQMAKWQGKRGVKTRLMESMSTTAHQVTGGGGGKTQDEHKKPFKNTSPEKGRPVLNTVQKRLEPSSILPSSKIRPQIRFNNKVTQQQQQQHWKMDVSLEK